MGNDVFDSFGPTGPEMTPRTGEHEKVVQTPIQSPWEMPKLTLFDTFRTLNVATYASLFYASFWSRLNKNLKITVFRGFWTKINSFAQSPLGNLTYLEQ